MVERLRNLDMTKAKSLGQKALLGLAATVGGWIFQQGIDASTQLRDAVYELKAVVETLKVVQEKEREAAKERHEAALARVANVERRLEAVERDIIR